MLSVFFLFFPTKHAVARAYPALCRRPSLRRQGCNSLELKTQEAVFAELNYLFIRKAPTPHSWKLLEFYLPQAYDLQPKTLCKESKD